jgi:hypothetical protein
MRTLRALIEGQAQWKDQAKKGVIIGFVAKYLRLDPEKTEIKLKRHIVITVRFFLPSHMPPLKGWNSRLRF